MGFGAMLLTDIYSSPIRYSALVLARLVLWCFQ